MQVGGLLGLGVFLWGISLLPIQRPLLVCECSVLVSPSEHAKLVEIGRESDLGSRSIDGLVCEPLKGDKESVSNRGSEGELAVRRIQLYLGMVHRLTAAELERELTTLMSSRTSLVRPSLDIQRDMCHARWRLQVAEHALSRFRLDCGRRGIELPDGKESSPFRLASRSSSSSGSDGERLLESLCLEVDAARNNLENAERVSDQRQEENGAFFTLGSSPRFFMRGGPLDRMRFVILVLSIGSILGFVAMHGNRRRSRNRSELVPATHQDLMKVLDRLRIAYLGVLSLEADDAIADAAEKSLTREATRSRLPRSRSLYRMLRLHDLSILGRWSERLLMVWIACFVLRYLLDPPWRELVFQAPLAAFSSILFGV